jgi:FkbM family methyltransferase
VEPLPANVKILQQVAKDIRVSPAFFHIHHAAVGASSDPPTIPFPDTSLAGAGKESVGVDFYKTGQGKGDIEHRVQVKHTSTDELFKNSQKIDMLLVDTEGNDPLVLLGSARVLQSVRYLEFENHKVGAWIKFDLKWIISYLDNLGMDCYWSGNDGGLFRITRCWHDVYSKAKLWSNIACVRRDDIWWDVLDSIWRKSKAKAAATPKPKVGVQQALRMVWDPVALGMYESITREIRRRNKRQN